MHNLWYILKICNDTNSHLYYLHGVCVVCTLVYASPGQPPAVTSAEGHVSPPPDGIHLTDMAPTYVVIYGIS